jgi:hypothetical protein
MPLTRSFTATVVRDASAAIIPLPFDPREAFGQVRAPVVATVDGYTFRTRIVAMGGPACVALRKAQVEESGLAPGRRVAVTLALDTAPRTVEPPADLVRALKGTRGALAAWKALSYTHQREHVEAIDEAKKPETRARRIAAAVAMVAARAQATAGTPSTTRSGGTHSARARASRTTSKL